MLAQCQLSVSVKMGYFEIIFPRLKNSDFMKTFEENVYYISTPWLSHWGRVNELSVNKCVKCWWSGTRKHKGVNWTFVSVGSINWLTIRCNWNYVNDVSMHFINFSIMFNLFAIYSTLDVKISHPVSKIIIITFAWFDSSLRFFRNWDHSFPLERLLWVYKCFKFTIWSTVLL